MSSRDLLLFQWDAHMGPWWFWAGLEAEAPGFGSRSYQLHLYPSLKCLECLPVPSWGALTNTGVRANNQGLISV